jgi:hypothetical protein
VGTRISIDTSPIKEKIVPETSLRYAPLLLLTFLAVGPLSASSIDNFTFAPSDPIFVTTLSESYTPEEAFLNGSVSCDAQTACSGELGTFDLGLDLTDPSTLTVTNDGTLSGTTPATGSLDLESPVTQVRNFVTPIGSFDQTRISQLLPAWGTVDVSETVFLTLQPGQTLTLPVTVGINAAAAPEPQGVAFLILAAALSNGAFVRYGRSRRTA